MVDDLFSIENKNVVPLQENFRLTSSSSGREKKMCFLHKYIV